MQGGIKSHIPGQARAGQISISVCEGFKDLDIGCPHLHRTLPPTVYSSDSDDEEERERVPPVHDGDADNGDHWMGHPFPCSSMGSCGNQLRIIRAAAVHYPLLRKFLNLLYLASWHHRRVLNHDNALCSADFRELMKLTDIESYGALYKGSKGESGCAYCYPCPHANVLGRLVLNSLPTGEKVEIRPWIGSTNGV